MLLTLKVTCVSYNSYMATLLTINLVSVLVIFEEFYENLN